MFVPDVVAKYVDGRGSVGKEEPIRRGVEGGPDHEHPASSARRLTSRSNLASACSRRLRNGASETFLQM